jgi:hypothetical protein
MALLFSWVTLKLLGQKKCPENSNSNVSFAGSNFSEMAQALRPPVAA